jgi:hypothetical protein
MANSARLRQASSRRRNFRSVIFLHQEGAGHALLEGIKAASAALDGFCAPRRSRGCIGVRSAVTDSGSLCRALWPVSCSWPVHDAEIFVGVLGASSFSCAEATFDITGFHWRLDNWLYPSL